MWPFSNKLFGCAKNGDAERLKKLIQTGGDVNKSKMGVSPLHAAADQGHTGIVEILLAAGADPNTATFLKAETPLHIAVKNGRIEMAKLLIKAQAEINAQDNEQNTPLHHAASMEDDQTGLELTRMLMADKADPIALNKDRDAPLTLALQTGREEMVRAMIDGLEDVAQVNSQGWNALQIMCESGDVKGFETFIEKGADIHAVNPDGQAPIHLAAFHRRDDILERLLDLGVDANMRGTDDVTPLHAACLNGTSHAVSLLIDRGADATAEATGAALTPLFIISSHECMDKIDLLAKAGVDIFATHPQNGFTLLHQAALDDNPELIKAAIQSGFDPQVWSGLTESIQVKMTPLHVASINNSPDAVQALLDAGAKVNYPFTDEDGRFFTPMGLALAHRHSNLVSMLKKAGGYSTVEEAVQKLKAQYPD